MISSGCSQAQVPSHWTVWKVAHAFKTIGSGTTPPTDQFEFFDGDVNWVNTAELRENIISETATKITARALRALPALRLYRPETIIIAMYGATIGRLGILGCCAATNQACCALADSLALSPRFTFYWLWAQREDIIASASGGGQPNINQQKISALRIAAPPMPEQVAIEEFLNAKLASLNALVSQKQRLIALLEEKRAALINRAVTRGLDPGVPLKDSGVPWLGQIPAHWKIMRIAMAADTITNGYVGPTRDILVEDGVRYIQSLHIKNGQIRFDRPYHVTPSWSAQHPKSILRKGDVLVVQTGDIGQCCSVPDDFVGCNCHALIIVRLKPSIGLGPFLARYLQSHCGNNELLRAQTGALHPHLECGKLREINVPFPPIAEQERIVAHIATAAAAIDKLVESVLSQIDRIGEYRSALISAAVTGKIDVRNYNVRAEAAAAE